MEEKSIDQLRWEAQELYQAKLKAYQQAQNGAKAKETPKPQKKQQVPRAEFQEEDTASYEEIRSHAEPRKTSMPENSIPKTTRSRNNWFVVSVFTILLLVVIMELFIISP